MKVTKLLHGQGVVKNIGNFESIKVYNEVEVTINEGDVIKDCHVKLRDAVDKLNKQDLDRILGE